MTHREAFLEDIRAHPDDDVSRLVYADWLEENGEPARAEFIRVQCRLARMGDGDPHRAGLQKREVELIRDHEARWLGDLREVTRGAIFRQDWPFFIKCRTELEKLLQVTEERVYRRGFLEAVEMETTDFLCHGPELLSREPVRHVTFINIERWDPGLYPQLAGSAPLTCLETVELQFHHYGIGDDGLLELAECPPLLERLSGFRIYESAFREFGLGHFLSSPHLRRLEYLVLRASDIEGHEGGEALATSARLPRLTSLCLDANRLGDEGVCALARSRGWPRLLNLSLRGCGMTDRGIRALARAPWVGQLDSLDLRDNGIGYEGAHQFTASPAFRNLSQLLLRGNNISDRGRHWFKARFGERVNC